MVGGAAIMVSRDGPCWSFGGGWSVSRLARNQGHRETARAEQGVRIRYWKSNHAKSTPQRQPKALVLTPAGLRGEACCKARCQRTEMPCSLFQMPGLVTLGAATKPR